MYKLYFFCFFVFLFFCKFEIGFTSESNLELGIGIGALSVPHYRGADQGEEFILPIPYIRYTGERLKVDREGNRYYLYSFGESKLDVSLALSLPVDSDNNQARESMLDLEAVIELGPRLVFYPYTSDDKTFRVRIGLPVRMAVATKIVENDIIGATFSPYLELRYFNYAEMSLSIGPYWATEKYHDYFYQVDSNYVTTQRSLYDAKAGYGGSRITLTLSKRFNKIATNIFVRYDLLSGAVFEDSPLVKQNTSLVVGLAFAYIL